MSFNSKYTGQQVEKILDIANQPKIIKYTHQELYDLYINKQLIPGQLYAITDYDCSYIHPSGGNDEKFEMQVRADDVKYIILLAIDIDKFDYNVQYIREDGYAKIIECKYTIDPQECIFTANMTTYSPKGAVFYMKDEYENECSYDFKHVKFRRYAIKDITANMDPNDGTGGVAGPYKCSATENSYVFSDTRAMIGSGDNWDKTFIPALFNGKWGSLVSYSANIGNYSDEFILQAVKPYQNTAYPLDAYLAWQTDMRETGGVSQGSNKGPCKVYGQAIVNVDSQDYKDLYTFSYEEQDASEMLSSTRPIVANNSIINTYCGFARPSGEILPNTVIIISKSATNLSNTVVFASKLISDTGVAGVRGNTILLRPIPGYDYAQMSNLKCEDSQLNSGFRSNLFISYKLSGSTLNGCIANLIIGDLANVHISDTINGNVLFGYYNSIKGHTLGESLLYGDFYKVQYEGQAIKNTADGNYWYNTVWRDWFSYNIIGPNQYSSFQPHFNTNTVRGCYNKGVEWHPTNQGSSFGRCVWGTNIGYTSTSGGIKFNSLIRTDISPCAFKEVSVTNSTGQELFNNEQIPVPTIQNCDIRSYRGNPQTITTDLTESQLQKLSNGTNHRYILTTIDDKWKLLYQNGQEVDAPTDPSEPDIPEEPVVETLGEITEDNN